MFNYPIYKRLKQELQGIAPVFYYLNQYILGKENQSYKVPAIYIETPKGNKVDKYPRNVKVTLQVPFKIHYISYAPFKSADSPIQDNALAEHVATLKAINNIMDKLVLKDDKGNLLTQQFIINNVNELNFLDMSVYSIYTYTTDVYVRP